MAKAKEQILIEKEKEQQIKDMPTRLQLDKLSALREVLVCTTPMEGGQFTEEQKWESIWHHTELQAIKDKILIIVRDL